MNYMILSNTERYYLEDHVADALGEGWELAGGVTVVWDGEQKIYYQAVTKNP